MLLYIVRHGIPDYATDSLTEEGHRQAEALAKRFARNRLDEVYVSPRGRAIETAKPTCDALGLEMKILPFMDESWAAKRFSFRDEDGTRGWCYWNRQLMLGDDSCFDNPADFGRGYYPDTDRDAKKGAEELKKNSDAFLKSLGYEKTASGNGYRAIRNNDTHIAAFCHQGFGLHWISYLLHIPFHVFTTSFNMTHTGVSVLKFVPEKESDQIFPMCLCLSDMSHLYAGDLPMLYCNYKEIQI